MASRKSTIIDHRERLNRVLVHIQENIDTTLSLDTLSEVACLSSFHFHRIFRAYMGETLNEYVRRIRLENAAFRLSHTDESVTSVALAAGYETPSSFTKAFRSHFGTSPAAFKKNKRYEKSSAVKLPDLENNKKEGQHMEAEVKTLPEQKVIFVRKTGRYDKAAGEAWSALMQFAGPKKLINKDTRTIGISHDDPGITPEEKIRYDACITVTADVHPDGEVGSQTISGGDYAVFVHKGPYDTLNKTYNAIFSQWLPSSGKKLRHVPSFEVYLNDPCKTRPEDLITEICVPVE